MIVDSKYMLRCLQLAKKGRGHTSPNPLVGAVVVYDDKIIGEGYHRRCGEAHAEVNAINSVKDKSLLKKSTLYVNLEPCSHYGKTPPCAQLIIDSEIPTVVIGSLDPFPQVAGRGVKMLEKAGVKTKVGFLKTECDRLNREFFTFHSKGRPYIYLKWAQSEDGYMDKIRSSINTQPTPISNDFTKMLVHKLRSTTDAIMVGTNTAIADNPSLTTRYWCGKNPIRVILDRNLRIAHEAKIYDDQYKTLIITEKESNKFNLKNTEFIKIEYDSSFLTNLFKILKEKEILSIMIEGGAQLLQYMIDHKMWDEAFIEIGDCIFVDGVKAPNINGILENSSSWKTSKRNHLYASHA